AAVPSPPTVHGWPKSVSAGTVLQGPSGGLVLVRVQTGGTAATAYRRDGRLLWSARQDAGCGNCDDGPQPVRLQADGTYGPIGFDGDFTWSAGPSGRVERGCSGVVFADGACVMAFSELGPPPGPPDRPVVAGRDAGATTWSWRLPVPGWLWSDDFNVPPMTVRDRAGIVYTAFDRPRPEGAPPGTAASGLLVAVDPVARRILWTIEGPSQALTGLTSGVLVAEPGGVAAYRADGTVAWRRVVPEGQRVVPTSVVHDPARGRVYLGRVAVTLRSEVGVTAVSAATGARAWRTRPSDRARLLSVGRGGRVYVAIDRAGHRSVRGLRLANATTAWERRTSLPVQSARELLNGTVAVSAGGQYGGPGRLTLLDPR
ncbi:MAG: PQQ-binding-like beta-propeller repeat protein, partial [Thermoleophilia bacterium]